MHKGQCRLPDLIYAASLDRFLDTEACLGPTYFNPCLCNTLGKETIWATSSKVAAFQKTEHLQGVKPRMVVNGDCPFTRINSAVVTNLARVPQNFDWGEKHWGEKHWGKNKVLGRIRHGLWSAEKLGSVSCFSAPIGV